MEMCRETGRDLLSNKREKSLKQTLICDSHSSFGLSINSKMNGNRRRSISAVLKISCLLSFRLLNARSLNLLRKCFIYLGDNQMLGKVFHAQKFYIHNGMFWPESCWQLL